MAVNNFLKNIVKVKKSTLLLLLFCIFLLGFQLGSHGLFEDNEARFFEISWEMERSSDWIVPRLNFISHFHKPPGTFWLVGTSLSLFGESEWAGRLPVALAALFTLAVTWIFALGERGHKQANLAVLILLTSLEFWFLSRLVLTDMFLTVTVTVAFLCAWRARKKLGKFYWLGFWLSLGFSTLFKGPIGLLIVLPTMLVFYLTSPIKSSWNLRWLSGSIIFLAIAVPWYAWVCLHNPGLLHYFLGYQTYDRVFTTVHGRPGPWWFYFPVIIAGFFPWSMELPKTLFFAWRRRSDLDRLLLIWVAWPLIVFSFSGSKLPTYLLPLFPALALLTAQIGAREQGIRASGTPPLVGLFVFDLAAAVFLAHGLPLEIQPAAGYLYALVFFLFLALLVIFVVRKSFSPQVWAWLPGLVFGGCLLILSMALGPSDKAYSAKSVAKLIDTLKYTELVEFGCHLHGLPYYLNRRIVEVSYPRETQFDKPEDYADYLYSSLNLYARARDSSALPLIVVRRSDYEQFRERGWPVYFVGHWVVIQPKSMAELNY